MDEATKNAINDDVMKMVAGMSREEQLEYMNFQEALSTLAPGSYLEFHDATFFRNPDGSLGAVLPAGVVDAFNKCHPGAALEGTPLK